MNFPELRPFSGFLCPGFSLSSGHSVFFYNFDQTPAGHGPFAEVWLLEPNGQKTLFVEPREAAEYICMNHRFDRIIAARLNWLWSDAHDLTVSVAGEDGSKMVLSFSNGVSWANHLLRGILVAAPPFLKRTDFMMNLAARSLKSLLGIERVTVGGRTETGRYFFADPNSLVSVNSVRVTLNDLDLGQLAEHPHEVDLGEVRIPTKPFILFGSLWLEPPGPSTRG